MSFFRWYAESLSISPISFEDGSNWTSQNIDVHSRNKNVCVLLMFFFLNWKIRKIRFLDDYAESSSISPIYFEDGSNWTSRNVDVH